MDTAPASEKNEKRVVVVHANGLHQIMGVADGNDLAISAEHVGLGDRGSLPFVSLYRVTTRAAYYKAPTVPQSFHTFHKAQK